jgi:PPOX class probable F420-dependent enzyme
VRVYAAAIGSRTIDELPAWAGAVLDRERVAHLAFVDEHDHPRVLPVTFAIAAGAAWSAIDEKPKRSPAPARLRHLRRRPAAALCVDRYDDDWSRLAWVQLLGAVEIVDAADAPQAMDALAARYAPYRARRPPGPLLRLEPERALHWRASGR